MRHKNEIHAWWHRVGDLWDNNLEKYGRTKRNHPPYLDLMNLYMFLWLGWFSPCFSWDCFWGQCGWPCGKRTVPNGYPVNQQWIQVKIAGCYLQDERCIVKVALKSHSLSVRCLADGFAFMDENLMPWKSRTLRVDGMKVMLLPTE